MLAGETIFLTGFPGFIATRLLRRLAANGGPFLLLVQPAFAERAVTIGKQKISVGVNYQHGKYTSLDSICTNPSAS